MTAPTQPPTSVQRPRLSPLQWLLRAYVALCGTISAYTVGFLQGYSPEHRRFCSSGYICQACKQFLIKKSLVADVIACDELGNTVPLLQVSSKAKFFACPRCGHKWPLRSSRHIMPA